LSGLFVCEIYLSPILFHKMVPPSLGHDATQQAGISLSVIVITAIETIRFCRMCIVQVLLNTFIAWF